MLPWLLVIGKVSLISNNRIQQNVVTKPSNRLPAISWTESMHHLILGCCVYFMCAFSLITHTVILLVMFHSTTLLAALLTLVLYFVFIFGKSVYYMRVDTGFPSESKEGMGHIVGISKHCGHALTWKILTQDTNKGIYHSQVCPFSLRDPNLCAELLCGEDDPPSVCAPIIKSCHVPEDGESKQITTPDSTSLPLSLILKTLLAAHFYWTNKKMVNGSVPELSS